MSSSPARPSVDRDTLVAYVNEFLAADQGSDYCPNGLQVEGRAEISKIVSGVSACEELFRAARQSEADAVLVHHGLFWQGDPPTLTGVQYRRVAELIRSEINLLAYHLPLDRHLEVGNNAVAAVRLGLTDLQPFCQHQGLPLGVRGRLPEPRPRAAVLRALTELFGHEPLTFSFGSESISSIGIVSGAGARYFHKAIQHSLDLFVTGEAEEWVMNLAREAGANFVAAGHHATERLGIQALGDHLRRKFGIDVEFVDIPNPV